MNVEAMKLVLQAVEAKRRIEFEQDIFRQLREDAVNDLKISPKDFNRLVKEVLDGNDTVFNEN